MAAPVNLTTSGTGDSGRSGSNNSNNGRRCRFLPEDLTRTRPPPPAIPPSLIFPIGLPLNSSQTASESEFNRLRRISLSDEPTFLKFNTSDPKTFQRRVAYLVDLLTRMPEVPDPVSRNAKQLARAIFEENTRRLCVLMVDASLWPTTSIGDIWSTDHIVHPIRGVAFRCFFAMDGILYALYLFTPLDVSFGFCYSAEKFRRRQVDCIFAESAPTSTYSEWKELETTTAGSGSRRYPHRLTFYSSEVSRVLASVANITHNIMNSRLSR